MADPRFLTPEQHRALARDARLAVVVEVLLAAAGREPISFPPLPDLARIARDVRDAQRARGARVGIRRFAVPYLVTTLKHADELGDALAARGVR